MRGFTDSQEKVKTKIWVTTIILFFFFFWWARILTSKSSISWGGKQSFQIDPSLKVQTLDFSIKWKWIQKLSTKHSVTVLCDIARVSLSGYYAWRKKVYEGKTQEDKEKNDKEVIETYVKRGKRKWGYRTITMNLERDGMMGTNNKKLNHKKVLRLMRKYNLLAKVRRKNPYKQIAKKTQEHSIAPNLLNREFQCQIPKEWAWPIPVPYTKLGTDITYIYFNHRWVYFSLVKDMVTGEALAHILSITLELTLVQETYQSLKNKYQHGELQWAISHSDQGFHYTHPSFPYILKHIWLIQSMSRKWNCIDNAPTESFFWHMKDELDYSHCTTFSELQEYFDRYIQYYNNERPQWARKKMTPVEYRNHLLEISKQKHIV